MAAVPAAEGDLIGNSGIEERDSRDGRQSREGSGERAGRATEFKGISKMKLCRAAACSRTLSECQTPIRKNESSVCP